MKRAELKEKKLLHNIIENLRCTVSSDLVNTLSRYICHGSRRWIVMPLWVLFMVSFVCLYSYKLYIRAYNITSFYLKKNKTLHHLSWTKKNITSFIDSKLW